jgi:PAS domain S-box-containing protein
MVQADIDKLLEKISFLEKRNQELENLVHPDKTGITFPYPELIYRRLLHVSPSAICVVSFEDGKILDASDVFCQVPGFAREEVIGKTSTELNLWTDEDREKIKALLSSEGEYRNVEIRHRKKDGSLFTSLDSGELVNAGGKLYVIATGIDITAYKEADRSLLNERDLNDTIIDSMPGLFCMIDENLKFLRWNKNLPNITGYSAEELREMTLHGFNTHSDRGLVSEEAHKVFRLGEHSNEVDIQLRNGVPRTIFFSARRMTYNKQPCLVASAFDITVQKRSLEDLRRTALELEEANTALRVFMKNQDTGQRTMEEKLQTNIHELVLPYLKKLKAGGLDERNMNYVNVLESNLNDILSPFITSVFASHRKLTRQEIQIADLIKKGKNTKEIAGMIKASVHTVNTHRNNIREKLNLRNSKVNLRTYLLSLK